MKHTLLILLVAILITAFIVYFKKLKKGTAYYPSPLKPQADFYDGEYVDLCENIERIKTPYQVGQATRAIYSLESRYRKHINPISLNFDINQLFLKVEYQKEMIEEGKIILPMV